MATRRSSSRIRNETESADTPTVKLQRQLRSTRSLDDSPNVCIGSYNDEPQLGIRVFLRHNNILHFQTCSRAGGAENEAAAALMQFSGKLTKEVFKDFTLDPSVFASFPGDINAQTDLNKYRIVTALLLGKLEETGAEVLAEEAAASDARLPEEPVSKASKIGLMVGHEKTNENTLVYAFINTEGVVVYVSVAGSGTLSTTEEIQFGPPFRAGDPKSSQDHVMECLRDQGLTDAGM
jgi:hypothetical protein